MNKLWHINKWSSLFTCQIQALRLLRMVLPWWEHPQSASRMKELVDKLFCLLGDVLLSCASDPALSVVGTSMLTMLTPPNPLSKLVILVHLLKIEFGYSPYKYGNELWPLPNSDVPLQPTTTLTSPNSEDGGIPLLLDLWSLQTPDPLQLTTPWPSPTHNHTESLIPTTLPPQRPWFP